MKTTKELIMSNEPVKLNLTREQFNDAVDNAFYRRIAKERDAVSKSIHIGILKSSSETLLEAKIAEGMSLDEAISFSAKNLAKKNVELYTILYNHLFGIKYLNESKCEVTNEEEEV